MVTKIHGGIINDQTLTGSLRYFYISAEGGGYWVNTIANGNQRAIGATVVVGGTGYALDDVLEATPGTGTEPTFAVTSIGAGGVVTGVSLLTGGDLSVIGANPQATTVTPPGGSGATLNVEYTSTIIIPGAGVPGGTEFFVTPGAPVSGSAVDRVLSVIAERATISQVAVSTVNLLAVAVENEGFAWDENDDGDAAAEMQTAIRALGAAVVVPDNSFDGVAVDLSGVSVTEQTMNDGLIV